MVPMWILQEGLLGLFATAYQLVVAQTELSNLTNGPCWLWGAGF